MRTFITYCLVSLLLIVASSTGYFYLLNAGLQRQKNDNFGKLNEVLTGSTSYDGLILGSSRAYVHLDPQLFADHLNVSVYNAGMDAIGIRECEMLLKGYLQNHKKPQFVLLNIDFSTLNTNREVFDYPQYFPYVHHDVVFDALSPYCPDIRRIKYLPFIGTTYYDETKKNLAYQGLFLPEKKDFVALHNGYLAQQLIWNSRAKIDLPTADIASVTPAGKASFERVLQLCKEEQLPLYLVYAPQVEGFGLDATKFEDVMRQVKQSADAYNVPFWRFDSHPMCADTTYFYNATHLNATGSRLYTMEVIQQLRDAGN